MANQNIIFGKRAVVEALKSGVPISCVYVADNLDKAAASEIESKALEANVPFKRTSKRRIDDMCDGECNAHQGIVAKTEPFSYASVADILEKAAKSSDGGEAALVVVCDHITDAGNLGAIARSAESVGACGIVIPNKRAAQVTPTTYKTSAGAVAHIPIAQVPNIARALDELKDNGFWVVAATEHAEDLLWDTDLVGRIALVMGNEQQGISELVLKGSDFRCKLPQAGEISSLNVAQASTVFMYEWLRQNVQA